MNKVISIAGRKIGLDYKPLVIAEIGINHGGSLKEAIKLVDAAKWAGAEIIKHQTHIPEFEMSARAKRAIPGNSRDSIWDIMSRCALTEGEEIELQRYIEKQGMIFISTPFSFAAVDRLERMHVPAYKIGSGEMNNYEFIKFVAAKNKPIILSTGMNNIENVQKAVECIRSYHDDFIILHTTNLYPTRPEQIRLGALEELKNAFPNEIIGLSDHSLNNLACLAATALGASVLERHFTDSKGRKGEDIICSMTPQECKELIAQSAEISKMRGGHKQALDAEQVTIEFAFSTIVASCSIAAGTAITREMLTTRRPFMGGILASDMDKVLGKKLRKTLQMGEHLEWEDLV